MITNMGDFDAIIFDLDGTLVDSLPDMTVALNRHLEDKGRRSLKVNEVRPLIGGGTSKMIQSAYALTGEPVRDDDLLPASGNYISYYREFPAKNSRVYDGVITVLDRLYVAGVKMGVCSNKSYEMVCLILESFGLAKYFCAVTGGDNVTFNKPDGRHILETLKRMNISSKNVLMVGDTVNDIVAANDAGFQVVAVDYGYSKPGELLSATIIIDGLSKLISLS
jgi:phosphoglycolate phosphatase